LAFFIFLEYYINSNGLASQHIDKQPPIQVIEEKPKVLEPTLEEKAEVSYKLGKEAFEEQNFAKAINYFAEAMKLNPGKYAKDTTIAQAYSNQALLFQQEGKLDEALEYYTRAIDLGITLAITYQSRAFLYSSKGDTGNAINDYSKAIELNPRDAISYHRRGMLYKKGGSYKEAKEDFQSALSLKTDPIIQEVFNEVSKLLKKQEQEEQEQRAREEKTQRIKRAESLYKLGKESLEFKDYNQAIEYFSQAITLNPNYIETYYNRANTYYASKQLSLALKDYNKVIALEQNDATSYYMRGLIYLSEGKYTLAKNDLEKSLGLKSDSNTQKALNEVNNILKRQEEEGEKEEIKLIGKFVQIPAGEFMMGGDKYDSEKPIHKVIISKAFEMGATQVTQKQWETVMGSNPSYFKGDKRLPVEQVSWDDVQQFISALNSKSKQYTYRLPTEAEWEYACRAGTTGDYAGDLDAMAWYDKNSGSKTHPVGEKQPNEWGLYDMHGNVWEWCSDWYGGYSSATVMDPSGPESGSSRVFRGGGCRINAAACRSAFRNFYAPGYRAFSLGSRLLRTPR